METATHTGLHGTSLPLFFEFTQRLVCFRIIKEKYYWRAEREERENKRITKEKYKFIETIVSHY